MAAKKKSTKQRKSKKTVGKKRTAVKKKTVQKKLAKKSAASKQKLAKKKAGGKSARAAKKRTRGKTQDVETVVFSPAGMGARAGGQSGSLQGLSDIEGADSESVDELIEEGNAFEAGVVKGVEDAPDADQGEVRTHEVPEDDVPEEYDEK
jgi:hypothetical protein